MSLSCGCDSGGHDWYYERPDDFSMLESKRARRCISCSCKIPVGADVLHFSRWRDAKNDIEDSIHGCEVPLAPVYMCSECGEIFLNLSAYGYCISLTPGENIREDLKLHWDSTGFTPQEERNNHA